MSKLSYEEYFPQELKEIFSEIESGLLGDPNEFRPLLDTIRNHNDFYLLGTDFTAYKEAQEKADRIYADKALWNAMSIRAAVSMEKFSSDRTIHEYAENIWNIKQLDIPEPDIKR